MKIDKAEKLVVNLHDKAEYIIHIENLKHALNNGLVLKIFFKVIKFSKNACPKPYIGTNTDLRKKSKNDLEKKFFKLMNNAVIGKHRDIKLVRTERRRNFLVSEPNYQITKFFAEYLLAIEMKRVKQL